MNHCEPDAHRVQLEHDEEVVYWVETRRGGSMAYKLGPSWVGGDGEDGEDLLYDASPTFKLPMTHLAAFAASFRFYSCALIRHSDGCCVPP
jgi:hypothetical protein